MTIALYCWSPHALYITVSFKLVDNRVLLLPKLPENSHVVAISFASWFITIKSLDVEQLALSQISTTPRPCHTLLCWSFPSCCCSFCCTMHLFFSNLWAVRRQSNKACCRQRLLLTLYCGVAPSCVAQCRNGVLHYRLSNATILFLDIGLVNWFRWTSSLRLCTGPSSLVIAQSITIEGSICFLTRKHTPGTTLYT